MRRDRKSSVKKERIIMITSSVFVLAALTMTGIYIKDKNLEAQDDGYTIDFTALDDGAEKKFEEIAKNSPDMPEEQLPVTDDDLDYMPLEAGSNLIEIPGLTDGSNTGSVNEQVENETQKTEGTVKEDGSKDKVSENKAAEDQAADDKTAVQDNPSPEPPAEENNVNQEANADSPIVAQELHFSESEGLLRPVSGEILMHYSMDGGILFKTLNHYKYNPAVVFSADEGTQVIACTEGKVVNIFDNEEIGHAITLDLGDGYKATYGQLKDISVTLNSYVDAGTVLGSVAAPTKYYIEEGSNLYFKLTKDGEEVNPENLF